MFTGLVTDLGRIAAIADEGGMRRFEIDSAYPAGSLELGASVMNSGVCLTLVDIQPGRSGNEAGSRFAVEAVPETLSRTTLGAWKVGDRVNLERSLKLGDELGGHFVFGHVDGVGEIVSVTQEGGSWRVAVRAPEALERFIAEKGSIAVDGISLTVAAVKPGAVFELAIIPHTWAVTTMSGAAPGRRVNLEIDMLARYVGRMLSFTPPPGGAR